MNNLASAVRAPIRNAVLCSLLVFGLCACGGESGSSTAGSVASDSTPSLVSQSSGVIDRSATEATASSSQSLVPSTSGSSSGATAAGASSSTTTGSNTTLVASTNRTSTNPSPSPANPTSSPTQPTSSPMQPTVPPTKVSNGTATLDWTPPTQNSDGTVLSNLAGYTVYYGTSPGNLTQSVRITNPGLTAYTMTNLASGTWYFTVTAYSSSGDESSRGGVVQTTI